MVFKPRKSVSLLDQKTFRHRKDRQHPCFRTTVIYRKKEKTSLLCVLRDIDKIFTIKGLKDKPLVHVIVPEETAINNSLFSNRSNLYFWIPDSRLLAHNGDIRVEFFEKADEELLSQLEDIQRKSWGFFIKPDPRLHTVLVGYINDQPVASAYYNRFSSNIDFGVHVARRYWRNRIGTRILNEILNYAFENDKKFVSVVRILGSTKLRSSDKRALAFYRANDPTLRFMVYRMRL